jgi:hypothetical protein
MAVPKPGWLGSGKKLPGGAALLDVRRGQSASAGLWGGSLIWMLMMVFDGSRYLSMLAPRLTETEHGSDFLILANALSFVYCRNREEKRVLEPMFLAAPGL